MMAALIEDVRELAQMPTLKALLAVLSSWALEMVGHPDSAARWLLYLMLFDLALGLARGWRTEIKGEKLKNGAFKFFRYWIAVAVFVMADAAIKKAFPHLPVSIRDTFIAYLAINEAFSCVDHLAFFGMPIPKPFLDRLRNYRDDCLNGEWTGEERRRTSDEAHAEANQDG